MPNGPLALGCDLDSHLTEDLILKLLAVHRIAAGRYLKNLTQAEVDLCKEYDFGLWLIAEGMGDAATFTGGAQRGREDGAAVFVKAASLQVPSTVPIFFAVDFPATGANLPNIQAYAAGFAAGAAPFPTSLYADGQILENFSQDKTYLAGAMGWPGSKQYLSEGKAALVQHPTISFAGAQIDPVDIYNTDVIWWPSGKAPDFKIDPVALTPVRHMPPLTTLQQWLVADGAKLEVDGVWGPATSAEIAKTYK